jgi:hypothetical protein
MPAIAFAFAEVGVDLGVDVMEGDVEWATVLAAERENLCVGPVCC